MPFCLWFCVSVDVWLFVNMCFCFFLLMCVFLLGFCAFECMCSNVCSRLFSVFVVFMFFRCSFLCVFN